MKNLKTHNWGKCYTEWLRNRSEIYPIKALWLIGPKCACDPNPSFQSFSFPCTKITSSNLQLSLSAWMRYIFWSIFLFYRWFFTVFTTMKNIRLGSDSFSHLVIPVSRPRFHLDFGFIPTTDFFCIVAPHLILRLRLNGVNRQWWWRWCWWGWRSTRWCCLSFQIRIVSQLIITAANLSLGKVIAALGMCMYAYIRMYMCGQVL